jgi:hypothetical protein
MHAKPSSARAFWKQARWAACRALIGGPAAAVVAGLFCLIGGAVLCWADGQPLALAGLWGLRGAFAGFVAGTIMGAVTGIYHVEEAGPADPPVETCKAGLANCNPAPARPTARAVRNGKAHTRLG